MMVTDFDENNFGPLDTFEFCAHSFATKAYLTTISNKKAMLRLTLSLLLLALCTATAKAFMTVPRQLRMNALFATDNQSSE
jgi:hypothetical protein